MVSHFEVVETVAPLGEVMAVVEVVDTSEDGWRDPRVCAVVEYSGQIVLVLESEGTPPQEVKGRPARDWTFVDERLDPC